MSVNNQPHTLKTDIKDFIQLLQKNQSFANGRRRLSFDSDKLSIIYSASQPQSSIGDKQNSHNSANKSDQIQQIDSIIKQIKRIGLNHQQLKLVDKLTSIFIEIKKNFISAQIKLKIIQTKFQQQKQGTDQILKALVKIDQAQKQLWSNYTQLSNRYLKLQQKCNNFKQQNQSLQLNILENHKDIQFMRKLVLVANQNYENIQRKCRNLQRNSQIFQRIKQQRSSPEITSRSTIINKKSTYSPTISDRSNTSAQKGGKFEQNYRRLVLRTLKNKAMR